jgi:hypothetical protein
MLNWFLNVQDRSPEITVSLTGGMGNQLFQIASGLYHSRGQGISVLDSLGRPRRTPSGLASGLQFDFKNQVRPLHMKELSGFWVKCAGFIIRRGITTKKYENFCGVGNLLEGIVKIFLSARFKFKYQIHRATGVGNTDLEITNSENLIFGYFQTDKWLQNPYVKDTMNGISLAGEEDTLKFFRMKADLDQPLVIHFRIGDYKNEPDIGLLPEDYYQNALEQMSKNLDFEKIWLFSDEPEVALRKVPDKFKSRTEVIGVAEGNDALTLQVMRFGRHYILSNSTFGWWAARLSHSIDPTVIVPNKWFKTLPEPDGLIPQDWLRIRAWN